MFSKASEIVVKLFVLYKDEEGQALAEYGLILGLIAVIAIAALGALGLAITGQLGGLSSALGGSSST
ncbi:MAG TPA: Flp family type IVb pilin [Dehalococcoidia bacterium]|jgi:pilus assembly protein Flp/PilA